MAGSPARLTAPKSSPCGRRCRCEPSACCPVRTAAPARATGWRMPRGTWATTAGEGNSRAFARRLHRFHTAVARALRVTASFAPRLLVEDGRLRMTRMGVGVTAVALAAASAGFLDRGSAAAPSPKGLELTPIGVYRSSHFDQGGSEIAAYDPATKRVFTVNLADRRVDVLDI